jgi:hypothetical protein
VRPELLDSLLALAQRLSDFIKWIVAGALVRRATQTEEKNRYLERINETIKKQQEVGARPPSTLSDLLERMRRGEL